ncbi:uncharacterized protein LOC127854214 isoform X1 [Dreissena polymorpha]|uniref:uncharacterized protein LOC127854214 isoform X1 n=1 Tax=Dreissena polymorpha TaxID=45954 RepID=UPI002264AFB1|nr:uncharacterized protein LOC127854214 isoform X1 [Dreissena polymorpha]
MTSKYYAPVILERFNSRQIRRHHRRIRNKQMSDFYNRQAVVPIDGPTRQIAVSGRLSSGDLAVFDDKAANAVLLDAEMQLKSGYPTIATSSMVARRSHMSLPEDVESQPDMKFFAELVKPVKKWKFQKEKLKTLEPSKHGFHQRSQSPTFRRLVSATEKLQHLVTLGDSDAPSPSVDIIETQVEMPPEAVVRSSSRYTKSEPNTTRVNKVESLPATGNFYPTGRFNFQPEVRTIEPVRREEPFVEEDEDEEDSYTCTPSPRLLTPPPPPPPFVKKHKQRSKRLHQEFKVDFKKLDSHSELHLFLPHIQDNSRAATPDSPNTNYYKMRHELPPINDFPGQKSPDDERNKSKKKQTKKKKKHPSRIKSGINDETGVSDHLNDVPTLISLANDNDYHPESMCVFEKCKFHQHRKTMNIRQP